MQAAGTQRYENADPTTEASPVAAVQSVLDRVGDARVAVAGDFCLDAYWELDPAGTEISIETGLPVHRVFGQRYELGGAGNVAANLRALGVGTVHAVGVVGDDPFGTLLKARLVAIGVDATRLRCAVGRATPVYVKPLTNGVESNRIDLVPVGTLSDEDVDRYTADLADVARQTGVLLVNQQLATSADPRLVAAVNALHGHDGSARVLVDARDVSSDFRDVALKINADEGQRLCEHFGLTEQSARSRVAALSKHTGQEVFMTLGEVGVIAADGERVVVVPGIEVAGEVDAVGAGDTAFASIGAALASGADMATAATFANVAASVVVTKLRTTGTAFPHELAAAANSLSYVFEPELAEDPRAAVYSAGRSVELIRRRVPARIRHVVFDHDGTLSVLREGWEQVMVPMMESAVVGSAAPYTDLATLNRVKRDVHSLIERTTGAPIIKQMEGLVSLIAATGLLAPEEAGTAEGYKAAYNEQLAVMVERRVERIRDGRIDAADLQIQGARRFLELLRDRGLTLHLASGTDTAAVLADADALGYADLFEGRIAGATDDPAYDAKRVVMDAVAADCGGDETFVVFGDGPVEIREGRRRGAVTVGVCSDERRRHEFNLAKRPRLIRAGADLLIPDYTDTGELLEILGI